MSIYTDAAKTTAETAGYSFAVIERRPNGDLLVFTYARIGIQLLADMSVYSAGKAGIERRTLMNVNMLTTLRSE